MAYAINRTGNVYTVFNFNLLRGNTLGETVDVPAVSTVFVHGYSGEVARHFGFPPLCGVPDSRTKMKIFQL